MLLFILLEIFCFNLIVRFNPQQNTIFVRSSGVVSGWVLNNYDAITQYIGLSKVSNQLAAENAKLLEGKYSNRYITFNQVDSIIDTIYQQQYELTAAKVINNSVAGLDNYFTLNRGSEAGISRGMGVMQENGVVGIVTDVNKRFARAISILNRDSKISVSLERSNFFGTLYWTGGDPSRAKIGDIPKHADIRDGDRIITSGYSAIFPKGIPIGTVQDYSLLDGSNFYKIDILLTNDLSNIKYVYVIKNLFKNDQKSLELENSDESNSQ